MATLIGDRPEGIQMQMGAVAASLVLGATGVLLAGAPSGTSTQSASMRDFEFVPATISVDAGDTVLWINDGTVAHTVTADDGSFGSGSIAPGGTFSRTFPTAGEVPYFCSFHGAAGGLGMAGGITVRPAVISTTSSSSAPTDPATSTTLGSPLAGPPATTAPGELARTGHDARTTTVAAGAALAAALLTLVVARRRPHVAQ